MRSLVRWFLAVNLVLGVVGCDDQETPSRAASGGGAGAAAAGAAGASAGSAGAASGAAGAGGSGQGGSGGQSGSGGSGGGGAGASGGAGSAGEQGCPEGSHQDGDGCASELSDWQKGPLLKVGRDHHVSFVATTPAGTFLFAGSGVGGPALAESFERSLLAADGMPGAFKKLAGPSTPVLGAGLAQIGLRFWLVGGLDDSSTSVDTTTAGEVKDDGSLAFSDGPLLNKGRYHTGIAVYGNHVFALGGLVQTVEGGAAKQSLINKVERATFDGAALGPWETLDALPYGVTHVAAFVHGKYVFFAGGISDGDARTEIQRAEVLDDGTLGPWLQAGSLPEGRATSAAMVFVDHVYIAGGATKAQGGEVATVLRAPIDEAGTVGTFEELAPLPKARAHAHQLPRFGGTIYSIAGSIEHVGQRDVFWAHLH